MCQIFVLLACGATLDVFYDPGLGTRPEVFLIDASDSFILSGVAIDGSFMPYVHQLTFQSLIWWDDKTSSLDISPEQFVQVVYVFDGVCPFPFFHQGVIMILDDCDHVFD